MKTPATSNWVAHTPPPAFAKASPKLLALFSWTVQPGPAEQLVNPSEPDWTMFLFVVQPSRVWIAIWFDVIKLIPSTISVGQGGELVMHGKGRGRYPRRTRTDFTVIRPQGTLRPERGPHRAPVRHVRGVKHPQAAVVVGIFARDTNLHAPTVRRTSRPTAEL